MALGSQTLLAFAAAFLLNAQPVELRHDHLWKSGAGTLTVTESGIIWTEPGQPSHNRTWNWSDIQQLRLAADEIRVLTYEDAKWRGYRDREYIITGLPMGYAASTLDLLRRNLAGKLAAAIAVEASDPIWSVPVKLHQRFGGSEGKLVFASGRLLYSSAEQAESRTWPLGEIEIVSRTGPYDLTVGTGEKAGWTRGDRQFRFQLKKPLSPGEYQQLWMAVQKANGLTLRETQHPDFASQKETQ